MNTFAVFRHFWTPHLLARSQSVGVCVFGVYRCFLLLQAKRRESPAEGSHRPSEQDSKQVRQGGSPGCWGSHAFPLTQSHPAVVCLGRHCVSTHLLLKLACSTVFCFNVKKTLVLHFGNNQNPVGSKGCPSWPISVCPGAARTEPAHGAASATAPDALTVRKSSDWPLCLAWCSPLHPGLSAISPFHEDTVPHQHWPLLSALRALVTTLTTRALKAWGRRVAANMPPLGRHVASCPRVSAMVFIPNSYTGNAPGPPLPCFPRRPPEATPRGLSRVSGTSCVGSCLLSGALKSERELKVKMQLSYFVMFQRD